VSGPDLQPGDLLRLLGEQPALLHWIRTTLAEGQQPGRTPRLAAMQASGAITALAILQGHQVRSGALRSTVEHLLDTLTGEAYGQASGLPLFGGADETAGSAPLLHHWMFVQEGNDTALYGQVLGGPEDRHGLTSPLPGDRRVLTSPLLEITRNGVAVTVNSRYTLGVRSQAPRYGADATPGTRSLPILAELKPGDLLFAGFETELSGEWRGVVLYTRDGVVTQLLTEGTDADDPGRTHPDQRPAPMDLLLLSGPDLLGGAFPDLRAALDAALDPATGLDFGPQGRPGGV